MLITFTHSVDGVPTTADSVLLSDPTGTYGMRRSDTAALIVADDTALVEGDTGEYSYEVDDELLEDALTYDFWVEFTYDGETNRVQRFTLGSGEDQDQDDLTFVLIDATAGTPVPATATTVKLSSEFGSYGAQFDNGSTSVADGTNYTMDDFLYTVSIPKSADAGVYSRFYTEVAYEGLTYWISRNTRWAKSSSLVLGRYTDSEQLEERFGKEELHKLFSGDEAPDYAMRIGRTMARSEQWLDDELRAWGSPFTDESTITLAATYATWLGLYEARGSVDVDPVQGFPVHRYSWVRKELERIMDGIRTSKIRLGSDDTPRYPDAWNPE
jgi:hypothetical protein